MKRTLQTISFVVILFSGLGCQKLGFSPLVIPPAPPKAKAIASNGARVEATGFAAQPAAISSGQSSTTIPLPKASVVTVEAPSPASPGKISVTLADNSALQQSTNSDSVSLPKNFPPPNAPTPTEVAKGKAVEWFYLAGLGLALAAAALIYLQHWMAAGVCAVGAFAVPTLGNLLSSNHALGGLLVFGSVAGALVGAWYLLKKKDPSLIAAASAKLASVETKIVSGAEELAKKL